MKHVTSTLRLAHVSKILLTALLLTAPVSLAFAEETTKDKAPTPAAAAVAKPAAAKPADAQGEHMGKIAVVDIQYLVANSSAGKSIRSQLEKQRESYKTQLEKQEADLRAQEKKLAEQQTKLSKEDFAKERKKFQDKVIGAQKSVQQRRIAFDKAYGTAMEKLREHVVKIVADLSAKKGVSLVMSRQELVLVDARLDMTNEVLKALDAKVTSIPVSVK